VSDNPLSEAYVEKKVREYAEGLGYFQAKFKSVNNRSVPDRLFINQHGTVIFIEFKRWGLTATPAQQRKHKQMHAMVFVVDDITMGKDILDLYVDWHT
jgi:hypothetical protein